MGGSPCGCVNDDVLEKVENLERSVVTYEHNCKLLEADLDTANDRLETLENIQQAMSDTMHKQLHQTQVMSAVELKCSYFLIF